MGVTFKDFLIKAKFNYKKAKYYQKCYYEILDNGLFSKNFYLNSYPNVAKSGMDPLLHYLFYGYKEGKSPSQTFDLTSYINKHPVVEDKNLNPLIHYLENDSDGFIIDFNPIELKKERIINTNSLFLTSSKLKFEPLVSIIILNKNGLNHLKRLFKDFDKNTNYSNYEIIVVDNASCDASVEFLYSLKSKLPITIIENCENVSFSKGNNDAIKIANGDYYLLLNNDIEPTFGWLNEMVHVMLSDDKIGAVGAKLIFPYYEDIASQGKSFSIQHAGVKFREEMTPYIYGPYHEHVTLTLLFSDKVNIQKEVISNTAACLLVSKEAFLACDGFDENYFYGYEDIDLALKLISNGYKSIYCPQALLFHHESATRNITAESGRINLENIMYFKKKWEHKFDKAILIDKIYNYKFMTNKKLSFVIINNNKSNNLFINKVTKYLNDKGYNVNLKEDIEDKIFGSYYDILLSFNEDFTVKDIYSKLNLIKVLVSSNTSSEFDIVIDNTNLTAIEFTDKLMMDIEDYYV